MSPDDLDPTPGPSPRRRFHTADRLLSRWSVPVGRIALGIIYAWFGALKVLNLSPVVDLIERVFPYVDVSIAMPVLGWVEILIGIGFLADRWYRVVVTLFAVHLGGTFLVLVLAPSVAFRGGNPLVLTMEGEFVIKNIALGAVGMLIAQAHLVAWHRNTSSKRREPGPGQ